MSDDLRARYTAALDATEPFVDLLVDAMLAARDEEMERLRAELEECARSYRALNAITDSVRAGRVEQRERADAAVRKAEQLRAELAEAREKLERMVAGASTQIGDVIREREEQRQRAEQAEAKAVRQ